MNRNEKLIEFINDNLNKLEDYELQKLADIIETFIYEQEYKDYI